MKHRFFYPTESMAESAGTYVSLRMTPVQEGVGEQTEHTSIATRVVNPRWVRCDMLPKYDVYDDVPTLGAAGMRNNNFLKVH